MGTSATTLLLAIIVSAPAQASESSGAIKQEEIDYQNQNFQQWWDTDLVWKFDELPTKGGVPKYRVPYSGYDYPDRGGGTLEVMRKYDLAFHNGADMAAAYEREDTGQRERMGLFGRRVYGRRRVGLLGALFGGPSARVPSWYGHCNGRTAASIRHAEPQKSVVRNGVVFTPADIKGLLAEIYMYNDTEFLGGIDYAVNPGTLHVILCNWIGRGSHPVGMDTTLGEVVFNYPIYAYATSSAKRPGNRVEVKMNIAYAKSSNGEYNRSPRIKGIMYFHYLLDLDDEGNIIGGRYYGDSAQVDMLWAPLKPVQGGKKGNEKGNPYIDVKEVLAIWRESVPEELRKKWYNIDPTDEDRIIEPEEEGEAEAADEAKDAKPDEAPGGQAAPKAGDMDGADGDAGASDGEEATGAKAEGAENDRAPAARSDQPADASGSPTAGNE